MNDKEIDYKKLAYECLNHLDMALGKLVNTRDWTGSLYDRDTGKTYSWEESFAQTMEKFPDVQIDRRYLDAKYLPKKQREAEYKRLNAERINP